MRMGIFFYWRTASYLGVFWETGSIWLSFCGILGRLVASIEAFVDSVY